MRRVVALATIVVVMAACSSNDLAEQGERSRAGKDKGKANAAEGGGGGKKGAQDGSAGDAPGTKNDVEDAQDQVAAGTGSGSEEALPPGDFGGADAPTSGIDPSLARSSGGEDDPATDAKSEGVAPDYTEATGARIQGLGKNVRFTISFAGPLPSRIQKDEYMVIAFGITGRKEGEGFALGAVGNEDGWEPYGGSKGDSKKLPGRFQISGNEVVFEVPWSYVKGPRAFEWYSSSGWYRRIANQTHWAFDGIPNERAGNFPG